MKNDRDLFRLEHILECTTKIIELVKLVHNFKNFETKWVEQDAMIRNFEIIGEASNHISNNIKQSYPEIQWELIRGMRNFITHEYFGVDISSIWETAINDIPILKFQIEKIISDLDKN